MTQRDTISTGALTNHPEAASWQEPNVLNFHHESHILLIRKID